MRLLLALSLAACVLVPAPRAECAWCSPVPCYGSCTGGCLCMRKGVGPGQCVSLQAR